MTERTACVRTAFARLSIAVAALLAASVIGPPVARAGDLHVHAGQLPDGTATTVGPWSGLSMNAPGGIGTFGAALGHVGQGTSTTATLVPPADLSIATATILRTFEAPVSADHSQPQIQSTWELRGYPYTGISGQGGYLGDSGAGTVTVSAPSSLSIRLACVNFDGVAGSCPGATYGVQRLDLVLHDDDAPAVSGGLSGPLVDAAGWQTGASAALRVVASDVGSGVYRAFIREGSRTWYAAADPASIRCRDAVPANATAYDFVPSALTLVPCSTAATQYDPTFDLTALGDGAHTVALGIEDAGGNERTVLTGQSLRINAPGGSLPDPGTACAGGAYDESGVCQAIGGGGGGGDTGGAGSVTPVPSPPAPASSTLLPVAPTAAPVALAAADAGNGERATASAQLTLRAGGSPRTRMTVGYGRAVTLTGTLTTRSGRPIAGATIGVAVIRAGTTTRAAGLVTDAAGTFTTVLPAGPSRTVRFGYRAFPEDVEDADSASIELSVRARARLSTTPRRLRNGSAVTLRGRVSGAPRRSRKLLELQVRQGTRWLTFATTRLRSGRFTYRYRFTRTQATTRYVFRVVVPADGGWPYATGASNHVAVTVRP